MRRNLPAVNFRPHGQVLCDGTNEFPWFIPLFSRSMAILSLVYWNYVFTTRVKKGLIGYNLIHFNFPLVFIYISSISFLLLALLYIFTIFLTFTLFKCYIGFQPMNSYLSYSYIWVYNRGTTSFILSTQKFLTVMDPHYIFCVSVHDRRSQPTLPLSPAGRNFRRRVRMIHMNLSYYRNSSKTCFFSFKDSNFRNIRTNIYSCRTEDYKVKQRSSSKGILSIEHIENLLKTWWNELRDEVEEGKRKKAHNPEL